MSVRMEKVEGEMKSVKGKMSEQEGRIAKLDAYLSNVGRETPTPRSMDSDANFETRLSELKNQIDVLTTEGKGKVDTIPDTSQSCTMVVGGLLGLSSLREATTWMADILAKLKGSTGQEMYMKTKGFLFVKFRSFYEKGCCYSCYPKCSVDHWGNTCLGNTGPSNSSSGTQSFIVGTSMATW